MSCLLSNLFPTWLYLLTLFLTSISHRLTTLKMHWKLCKCLRAVGHVMCSKRDLRSGSCIPTHSGPAAKMKCFSVNPSGRKPGSPKGICVWPGYIHTHFKAAKLKFWDQTYKSGLKCYTASPSGEQECHAVVTKPCPHPWATSINHWQVFLGVFWEQNSMNTCLVLELF